MIKRIKLLADKSENDSKINEDEEFDRKNKRKQENGKTRVRFHFKD